MCSSSKKERQDLEVGACSSSSSSLTISPITFQESTTTEEEEREEEIIASEEEEKKKKKKCLVCNLGLVLFVVGVSLEILLDSAAARAIRSVYTVVCVWIQSHPTEGFFLLGGAYTVSSLLLIPGSLLTLGSGFVYARVFGLLRGVVLATTAIWSGASLAAILAFCLVRHTGLAQLVQRRLLHSNKKKKNILLLALDRSVQQEGLRIMVLLRLSPLIPINLLNYLAGVTNIGFGSYATALVALLPRIALYVYSGASAGTLVRIHHHHQYNHPYNNNNTTTATAPTTTTTTTTSTTVTLVATVVGIVLAILAVCLTSFYARRELHRIMEEEKEKDKKKMESEETKTDAKDDDDDDDCYQRQETQESSSERDALLPMDDDDTNHPTKNNNDKHHHYYKSTCCTSP